MTPEKFYIKYIKPCKKLREVELPSVEPNAEIRIEHSLLDWRICYTPPFKKKEKYISCKSELEARYLKVWLENGVSRIKIPKDEAVLADIVPKLEGFAQKVKKLLEDELIGYRPKTQRAIVQGVWEVSSAQ